VPSLRTDNGKLRESFFVHSNVLEKASLCHWKPKEKVMRRGEEHGQRKGHMSE